MVAYTIFDNTANFAILMEKLDVIVTKAKAEQDYVDGQETSRQD